MAVFSDMHSALSQSKDNQGQPLVRAFRSEAVLDRQIDELIGIIKGVMADGMVHQGEVEFLLQWLQANSAVRELWPAKAIYPRLIAALADGLVDLEEEREIMDLLLATIGGNTAPQTGQASDSTFLPLTSPAPAIAFPSASFCFTGKFRSGTRSWCEEKVTAQGGAIAGVSRKLNFLVIGDVGSRDWIHSTHGRKIESAIAHNDAGGRIAIVSEEHWFTHI
jgi:NAD-dependent DNA ligase